MLFQDIGPEGNRTGRASPVGKVEVSDRFKIKAET